MTRLLATLRRDVLLQSRYSLYAVSVFVVVVWGAVLTALPDAARPSAARVVPAFLVANLIVTTFYFVGALILLERDEGMLVPLITTPLRETEYLVSKAGTLTGLALAESLLLAVIFFGLPHMYRGFSSDPQPWEASTCLWASRQLSATIRSTPGSCRPSFSSPCSPCLCWGTSE